MSASKLFQIPIEKLIEIYSKFPADEIKKKRSISKKEPITADLALFSQTTNEAIRYQTHLLIQWSDQPDVWNTPLTYRLVTDVDSTIQ